MSETKGQHVTEEPEQTTPQEDEGAASQRPAPRNPFAEPEAPPERPALIETRRSAALAGVITGLIALVFFVLICVAAAYAFS